ncbi:tRNA (uracil-5-)-methyltransferase homolog A [Culex pipiens pallens]|uniref:tRNA (uracil-5-)-methyltransferase homolog A n=1 Tax=Culex pipiens pallens TaxID=42434 RepID=UPI0019534CF1|nr:tRNA (uracil-5-)-methyltransferase homolog A [Culex pipiens pallens]
MEAEPVIAAEPAVEESKQEVEKVVPEEPVESAPKKSDEFAYLDAAGFSSERFKIEIKNLPKYYGINEMKKLLNVKLSLATNKIKIMRPGCPFLFVCFRDDSERQAAIKAIDGYTWKGKKLQALEAKPSPDPLVKRRNESTKPDGVVSVKKRRTLEESVTALAYLSYEDQLKQKQSEMHNVLKGFGDEVWKSCPTLRSFIEQKRKEHDGLPCKLEDIRGSPQVDGYRNKCEFSIGKDGQGEVRVGFRVGSYSNGFLEVESPDQLKHISEKMKSTVKLFEEFVQKSEYEVYSPETYKGYFRQLTVRTSNATGQVMVVIGIHPQELGEEKLSELRSSLVSWFTSEKAKEIGISSIYFQTIEKFKSGQNAHPTTHLWGETHIIEEIHGLKFRVSPQAFFQINTPSAEILYQTAIDLAGTTKQTSILDICCGTGTIGLCFAKHCKQVLGVEIVAEAIADATHNAKENGIENCKFYTGNADDLITSLVRNANVQKDEDLVAIVDPPRAGLHIRSITQLRNARGLNRLIYVSCSPQSAVKNWADLMRPRSKVMRGGPFMPKRAIPVDLFPHTPHAELIVLFEREPEQDEEEEEEQKKDETEKVEEKEEGKVEGGDKAAEVVAEAKV